MVGTIKTWIIIAVIGAGCIGAAGLYGPGLMKNMFPQFFIARAAVNLSREVMTGTETLQTIPAMIEGILRESWRKEIILGIDHLEGDIVSNIDTSILAVAPMLSLRNVSRWDNIREAFEAELALQMAVTTIVSADLHLERELIAVNIPMLFDFGITADPRRLGSDWDNSILGSILFPGMIDDELFYQLYEDILFEPGEEIDFSGFTASLAELAKHIEFEYAGRQTLDDTEQMVDVFYLTIPANYAEASLDIIIQGAGFTDDLTLIVYVDGSRMVGVDFEAGIIIENTQITKNSHFRFPEAGRVQFEIIMLENLGFMHSANGYLVFDNGPGYYVVSFDINFVGRRDILVSTLTFPFTAGANGRVRLYPQEKRIEADFNNLSLSWQDNDVSVNIRYLLRSDNEPVIFDKSNARPLTDLNIFDLLGVYTRLEGSPLSGFFGSLLP